jgi:hypothetical protein
VEDVNDGASVEKEEMRDENKGLRDKNDESFVSSSVFRVLPKVKV